LLGKVLNGHELEQKHRPLPPRSFMQTPPTTQSKFDLHSGTPKDRYFFVAQG
jgi:hypothetical protein